MPASCSDSGRLSSVTAASESDERARSSSRVRSVEEGEWARGGVSRVRSSSLSLSGRRQASSEDEIGGRRGESGGGGEVSRRAGAAGRRPPRPIAAMKRRASR